MAAAERIRDLRAAAAGQLNQEDDEILGLHLVEDVLWGYDVNLTATHMAASTLGMLVCKGSAFQAVCAIWQGVPIEVADRGSRAAHGEVQLFAFLFHDFAILRTDGYTRHRFRNS